MGALAQLVAKGVPTLVQNSVVSSLAGWISKLGGAVVVAYIADYCNKVLNGSGTVKSTEESLLAFAKSSPENAMFVAEAFVRLGLNPKRVIPAEATTLSNDAKAYHESLTRVKGADRDKFHVATGQPNKAEKKNALQPPVLDEKRVPDADKPLTEKVDKRGKHSSNVCVTPQMVEDVRNMIIHFGSLRAAKSVSRALAFDDATVKECIGFMEI